MSRSPCCGEGSGRCEKPENSQEVTFLRLTPQSAFKEVDTREIYGFTSTVRIQTYSTREERAVSSTVHADTAGKWWKLWRRRCSFGVHTFIFCTVNGRVMAEMSNSPGSSVWKTSDCVRKCARGGRGCHFDTDKTFCKSRQFTLKLLRSASAYNHSQSVLFIFWHSSDLFLWLATAAEACGYCSVYRKMLWGPSQCQQYGFLFLFLFPYFWDQCDQWIFL